MLDNVKLSESDYPDAVKEVVTRSRLTVIEFNKGEDEPLEQYNEGEMSDDSDADSTINMYKSKYDHNLEDYRDWHYDRAPIVPDVTVDDDIRTVRNAENNDDQCPAVREGNEGGTDEYSEPGGRARSELSPEKAVRIIDTFGVDSVTNDDITVNIRDSAGVSDMHDDEIRMVSMITVDVSQGNTNSHSNNSLGIRDCVSPVSDEEQDSAAHMDLRLGSIRNLTVNCFGVCDLTHRLNHPGIDWCWVCIDRLIWGYRVSCLVTIVTKDRAVGMGLFIEGSCVYASTQGLEDGPVIPCDVIPVYVWMTEKFKDVLNKVMLVDKATVNSHSLQWGEDNRQVRGTRASVDNRPIRVAGRFGCLYSPVQGADWLDVLSVGGGPVGKDVGIGYFGDGFSQYQLISLGSFPDKVGLFGRRKEAAVSRIMAGRDSRSVRFVVPDGRIVDRGYHDVTVVDMEEEREPMVVLSDMTRLRELWPVEVFDHMKWYQQDLELLRKSAKKDYQQTRPMPCRFCGKVIRVDMYRHVARLHLDLVQLWRCPIAWCTTWKGSPQDCLEHVRSGHDAPWVSKTASIEKYAPPPPWTVRRQLWTDSLRIEHSGISTDMLLFSEVGMPLTQHYRVYKGGLPHAVFRTDYLPHLRSLLPSPGGADTSPDDQCGVTPTSVRRPHRLSRPKRLFPDSVAISAPILTEQNPAEMIGETVIDCRPSLLPVSIPLSGLSRETISGARDCVSYIPSEETGQSIMNMDTSEITINRIVGFPWNDGGTDVEDELPTPAVSPNQIVVPAIPPAGTDDPFGRGESFDLELAKVICEVSVLPPLVTPLVEVVTSDCATVADYAPPAVPPVESVLELPECSLPDDLGGSWMPDFVPGSDGTNTDEGGFLQSLREPLPSLTETPPNNTPMVTESSTPSEVPNSCGRNSTPVPSVSPAVTEGVVTAKPGPDLSREGPFDACDADHDPGQSPIVMDSMAGCQYRMTSYEERMNVSDMDPSYGIHMHDPRVIEYMGAPESARLLGRTPEYWLEHMGRERTIQAALPLHHDASLIMTNIQVMSQLATSFSRAASEVMRTVHDREPFPTDAVDLVTPGRRVRRAAHYMAAMGLWRPTSAPVFPGPVSASSCNSCMACDDFSRTGESITLMPPGYELCLKCSTVLCVIVFNIAFYV